MSLLNVLLDGDKAYVSVDTEFKDIDSSNFFNGDKMLLLPCAGIIFASRGERTFLHWVFNWYLTAMQSHEFDSIEENLDYVAYNQFEGYSKHCRSHGIDSEIFENIQLAVVGFSSRDQRFVGINLTRRAGAGRFVMERMKTGVISPAINENLTGLRVPNREAWLVEVAKAQVRQEKGLSTEVPIGGRLLVAEATRDEISIRNVCALGT